MGKAAATVTLTCSKEYPENENVLKTTSRDHSFVEVGVKWCKTHQGKLFIVSHFRSIALY